tara:strand:+ start:426 stop:620 length:195 start_codon:yes stop_codon:yes gene_type:complete
MRGSLRTPPFFIRRDKIMMGKMKKKPMLPRQMPKKPKAKKDEQGRYSLNAGGLVAKAMEVQKPN